VEAVLADYTSAPIDDAWKALFAFIQVDQAAVDAVKAAGWSEEAIYDAITVCALFNFFNRWIDGTGVSGMNAKAYEQSGHRMKTHGYAPPGRIVLDK
jgi:alkylhydroperoxidase family enzyme